MNSDLKKSSDANYVVLFIQMQSSSNISEDSVDIVYSLGNLETISTIRGSIVTLTDLLKRITNNSPVCLSLKKHDDPPEDLTITCSKYDTNFLIIGQMDSTFSVAKEKYENFENFLKFVYGSVNEAFQEKNFKHLNNYLMNIIDCRDFFIKGISLTDLLRLEIDDIATSIESEVSVIGLLIFYEDSLVLNHVESSILHDLNLVRISINPPKYGITGVTCKEGWVMMIRWELITIQLILDEAPMSSLARKLRNLAERYEGFSQELQQLKNTNICTVEKPEHFVKGRKSKELYDYNQINDPKYAPKIKVTSGCDNTLIFYTIFSNGRKGIKIQPEVLNGTNSAWFIEYEEKLNYILDLLENDELCTEYRILFTINDIKFWISGCRIVNDFFFTCVQDSSVQNSPELCFKLLSSRV
ncbi:DgyrCDS6652 [Dimorphilus gyrociliatus]|uniref:DgyrCDS6652 n=1 Tax=Dimorphilus gyrociliatus TaxID=2664684 RepID=A0A7I8VPB1_9ANNE|nr:DgyrCDS6652 [Dimorphilus gyrociliatus]